jgi:2-polyprenyl-6-methoxyphenol hydroxylase-like FAD-dependent oxidoreductase
VGTANVVVVGAGPVGLTVAWQLAAAGVPVTVLEDGEGPGSASRASTFHPPTLDLLDDLGVAADLLPLGLQAPVFQYRDRAEGVVAQFDCGLLAGEVKHAYRLQCEQDKLCALLARGLAELPGVELRYGHRVTGVVPDGDGARVEVEGRAGLRGRWIVGADGAHSAVRRSLGIDFEGITYPERFLVVSTRFPFADAIDDLALINYISDPDEWLVLLRTPDHWRALFPVPPDVPAELVADSGYQRRLLAGICDGSEAASVLHASSYRIHQRVAATFRRGAVLLAGDAAHVNNPLGGMGMNSGLHDAVSLGRRLVAACTGGGDAEELLDGYAHLRRRITTELVDARTRANLDRIREQDERARQAHHEHLRVTAADPARARDYVRASTLVESAAAL